MTIMSDTDPLVGHLLDGRYEIIRKLARGGMATVYLATDRRLDRTVAVKVMHDSLGGDEEFTHRFDREARAAAGLSHPNVVSVFDQGTDAGRSYIVMEYVEGSTLRNVIQREAPMSPQRALELLDPVVAAVAAAHEAGIIHRDLKPENVLISTRGQIKVADFGLARAANAHTASMDGTLIGTVSYIAPELVTQGHADTRCDVYALGVVLFEMLTGRKPHTGDSPIQIAYSHVHNEITAPSAGAPQQWRGTRNAVPPYLDALVTTAAARDVADRPLTATVLLDHVRAAREAIDNSVADDPALTARMREVFLDPSTQLTAAVPTIPGADDGQRSPTLRFTPSTPISPSFPGASDGMPYYDDMLPSAAAVPLQQRRARRRRRGIIGLIALLVATALIGVGTWYWVSGRFTATPDFSNLTQADAEKLAATHGLNLAAAADYSETVPSGQVIRTDPGKGEQILRGGTVTVYLSKGPERYAVPSLAGRSVDDATAALQANHLALGKTIEVFNESVEVGQVISASQDAGVMVKPGTPIDLNVSKGPAPVEIVSYVNKLFTDAQTFYQNAGLVVQRAEDQFSSKVAAGNVISQDPKKGTVAKNGTITFTVSKGPEMVTVPAVRWKSTDDAKKLLTGAGFKVKVVQKVLAGIALWTDPAENTSAPKGSTVTLYVG